MWPKRSAVSGPAGAVPLMVAGWDFSQYFADGFLSLNGVDLEGGDLLSANYSDFDPTFGAGAESAAYGTMYSNGQFGSTDTPLDFSDPFVASLARSLASNRAAPAGPDFGSHAAFNVLLNEGQTFANPMTMTALGAATVVFGASLLHELPVASATGWVLSFGASTFSGAGVSTIGIELSTDGVSFQSFGSVDLTSIDTPFSIAFGPSASEQAFARLTFSDPTGEQAFLGNVALSADVTFVPEPGATLLLSASLVALVAIRRLT